MPSLQESFKSCKNSHVKGILTQDEKMSILRKNYVFLMEFAFIEQYIVLIHNGKRQ